MKILCLLLVPILTFGQNSIYPDTLYLQNGYDYPCIIEEINDLTVKAIIKNSQSSSAMLFSIDKIVAGEKGTIYDNKTGFLENMESLNNWFENRIIERPVSPAKQTGTKSVRLLEDTNQKKWSFGFDYSPLVLEKLYELNGYSQDGSNLLIAYTGEAKLSSQFTYYISNKIRASAEIAYEAGSIRKKYLRQHRNGQTSDNGYETTDIMTVFKINLGIKYYLIKPEVRKVSALISGGIGKKFAFFTNEYKDLFPGEPSDIKRTDNLNDYLSQANSPYFIYASFGVEYYFDESLSLSSNMRYAYSRIDAKFKSTETRSGDYSFTRTRTNTYNRYDIENRVSIGLNFYF